MNLREAHWSDAKFLYEIHCNAIVRHNSVNPNIATYAEHLQWLSENEVYVAVVGDERVGTGRILTGGYVSLAVHEKHWRKGYGKRILRGLMAMAEGDLYAHILSHNEASKALFSGAGFELVDKTDWIELWICHPLPQSKG
jgi:L-amino acid N-acyltransferase YncA